MGCIEMSAMIHAIKEVLEINRNMGCIEMRIDEILYFGNNHDKP